MDRIWSSGRALAVLGGVVFFVLVVLSLNRRVTVMRELEAEAGRLQATQQALEVTRAVLQTQLAEATSEANVRRWAMEEGRMVQDGDHLVVPLPATTVTPPPLETKVEVQTEPLPNWRVWLALLFGDDAP